LVHHHPGLGLDGWIEFLFNSYDSSQFLIVYPSPHPSPLGESRKARGKGERDGMEYLQK
jgi:hypothetical protein